MMSSIAFISLLLSNVGAKARALPRRFSFLLSVLQFLNCLLTFLVKDRMLLL